MRLPLARGAGIATVIAAACAACGTLTGASETAPADGGLPPDGGADAAAVTVDAGVDADAGSTRIDRYRAAVLADAPIGYWPFDDPPGSPIARAIVGPVGAAQNVPITGEPGPFGPSSRAIRFDGTTDMQIVVSDPSLAFRTDAQPLSIECWYEPTGTPDPVFRHLFAWYVAPSGWGVYETDAAGISFERISSSTKHSVNAAAPARSQWHHLVATSTPGKALTIFVDGVPTYETGAPGTQTLSGAGPLRIGGKNQTASIVASIAEVALYDKELSPAQVATHRARGLAP